MSVPGAGGCRGASLAAQRRLRAATERTGVNGEGRAPRGASRSSRPEPRRESPRPSLAFPLDPSWHFRDFRKDALRFRGKEAAGAGELFAWIIRKVLCQFGDARFRRWGGWAGVPAAEELLL